MRLLVRFTRAYAQLLEKHTWKVQIAQTGGLMAVGDVLSQVAIEKKKMSTLEWDRVARFFVIGSVFVAPGLKVWYEVLDKYVKLPAAKAAVGKMLLDQGVFCPFFLANFLAINGAFQGHSWNAVSEKVQREYFDILKTNYMVWPWVQLTNFYVVPLQYRILVVQTVAIGWNTYLAWKTNRVTK